MWQQDGFLKGEVNVNTAMQKLAALIEEMNEKFKGFSPEALLNQPVAGKWSKQQVLGHLIDSAINNLKRFTEITFLPQPYVVQSYQQNELVAINNYQKLPITHLLELWTALNRQIIFVVQNIPQEALQYPVDPQYDNHEMKTLGWIICDYVAHMEHHLTQVEDQKG